MQLTSNVAIYGLGIRYNGTAFTSIGALSNVPSGNKVISHLVLIFGITVTYSDQAAGANRLAAILVRSV